MYVWAGPRTEYLHSTNQMKLDGKTTAELVAMKQAIAEDPSSASKPGDLYLFNKKARAKLDKIDRQITENLRVAREEAGDPVKADGYSGRQSNRRR